MAHARIHFLDAKPREEARRIWHEALRLDPLPAEPVALAATLGRVLAEDVRAPIDVPPFDRSVVDGFACVAADTFAALETEPSRLRLLPFVVLAGVEPECEVGRGEAVEIATGGVLPRGANGVQMVERTELDGAHVLVFKAIVPGANVQSAGSDLRAGEVVLARGTRLSSRETGVLAALGLAEVSCIRRPRVALLSTGDELLAPGVPLRPGHIYDSNARAVADALAENGAVTTFLGIVPDDEAKLEAALLEAREFDAVVLSGGTSKGTGDLSFRLIDALGKPGILVHGVQVKPGKPLVLAAWEGRPVAVLPGFPTSAILTLNLFVLPVIRRLGGLPPEEPQGVVEATLPQRVHSAPGRYEYVLANLVRGAGGELVAWPVAKSSGSISAFSEADGYIEVPESRDLLLEGERARVTLLSRALRLADLTVIGSHCQGMDLVLATLRERHGLQAKVIHVGSSAGVAAVRRGEADVAGVHLLGADGRYNREALAETEGRARLVHGYRRRQGILYRRRDFPEAPELGELVARSLAAAGNGRLRLLNRPRGAGTRVLLDDLLERLAPALALSAPELRRGIDGYDSEARSHGAAAAAIAGGKADWGLGIRVGRSRARPRLRVAPGRGIRPARPARAARARAGRAPARGASLARRAPPDRGAARVPDRRPDRAPAVA